MTQERLIQEAERAYAAAFSGAAEFSSYAPGRVNLLGEHTDYNGGLVLPMPLAMGTAAAIGRGGQPGTLELASAAFEGVISRDLSDAPDGSWSDYVLGSLVHLLQDRRLGSGIRIMITSDIPLGAGLSSSAALEVATLRAACQLFDIALTDVEVAQLARKAENDFVGMPCGIMDQYAVSVGQTGSALFLDTRQLTSAVAKLPETHAFVVIHSGVSHKLTDDGYEQRVTQCTAACQHLGVELLSDLGMGDLDKINQLPAPLDGRARHIITENDRVARAVDALNSGDTAAFAAMMTESHVSQRDDYAVSVPEVDALVQGALNAGAQGARLTGGGFGGSIVALVKKPDVAGFCTNIATQFPSARVLAVT